MDDPRARGGGAAFGAVAAMALIDSHALTHGLQLADALITATALEHGLVLLSGNKKHFAKLPGLDLEVFKP